MGTYRYGFEGNKIADKVDMVFFIGGDGTHRGILALSEILKSKKY